MEYAFSAMRGLTKKDVKVIFNIANDPNNVKTIQSADVIIYPNGVVRINDLKDMQEIISSINNVTIFSK